MSENKNCYSWGSGSFGKLGHGDTVTIMKPKLIEYFDYDHNYSNYFINKKNELPRVESEVIYASCSSQNSLFVN